MHTVYLSQIIEVDSGVHNFVDQFQLNFEYLKRVGDHNSLWYFEELPTCPLCLEKVDTSASGIQFCMLYETHSSHSPPGVLEGIDESDFESLDGKYS